IARREFADFSRRRSAGHPPAPPDTLEGPSGPDPPGSPFSRRARSLTAAHRYTHDTSILRRNAEKKEKRVYLFSSAGFSWRLLPFIIPLSTWERGYEKECGFRHRRYSPVLPADLERSLSSRAAW